jgi:hypothetical protein
MKYFPSILKLLADQGCARSAPQGQRLLFVESLEQRCVLSGVVMYPPMENHGGFDQGVVDCDDSEDYEEQFLAPRLDHGHGPGISEAAEGEFDPPMHDAPDGPRGLTSFSPPPRQESLQPPREFERITLTTVIVIVTRPPASAEPAPMPAFSGQERPAQGPLSGVNPAAGLRETNTAGNASIAATISTTGDLTVAKSRAGDPTIAIAAPETSGLKSREDGSVRDETVAQKLPTEKVSAVQTNINQADGLIELAADDVSQRSKRKSAKAIPEIETSSAERLERLTKTLRLDAAAVPTPRLPLSDDTTDRVLAFWEASGPAWSPEDSGLVEILAADVMSSAGRIESGSHPATGTRHDASAGLHAEVGIYQAFDLASDRPIDLPVATVASPVVSTANRQHAPVETAE